MTHHSFSLLLLYTHKRLLVSHTFLNHLFSYLRTRLLHTYMISFTLIPLTGLGHLCDLFTWLTIYLTLCMYLTIAWLKYSMKEILMCNDALMRLLDSEMSVSKLTANIPMLQRWHHPVLEGSTVMWCCISMVRAVAMANNTKKNKRVINNAINIKIYHMCGQAHWG
jgi:hypothetical protein